MNLPGVYKVILDRWAEFQTVWICSDPHLGDQELREGIPGRPSDDEIVKNLQAQVGKKDVLIVLGDVCDIEPFRSIKGYKILVCGNHDRGVTNYNEVFDEIYEGPWTIGEKLILSHEPLPNCPWWLNLHGHVHRNTLASTNHVNCCLDANDYKAINLNQFLKSGPTSKIQPLHRITIDRATTRARKRGNKKKF